MQFRNKIKNEPSPIIDRTRLAPINQVSISRRVRQFIIVWASKPSIAPGRNKARRWEAAGASEVSAAGGRWALFCVGAIECVKPGLGCIVASMRRHAGNKHRVFCSFTTRERCACISASGVRAQIVTAARSKLWGLRVHGLKRCSGGRSLSRGGSPSTEVTRLAPRCGIRPHRGMEAARNRLGDTLTYRTPSVGAAFER